MNHRLKISLALLTNFSLVANQLLGQLSPVDFESPTFVPYQSIQAHTPDGWNLLSGQAEVTGAGEGQGGGQALNLEKSQQEAWLQKEIDWDPAEKTAFIDFHIKSAVEPEGSLATFIANGTQLAFQAPSGSAAGQLWAFHGGDGANGSSQWYLTPGSLAITPGTNAASNWMRVTLRQDYDRNLWDLFIDGKLAAVNLSFEGRQGEIDVINFFGSRHGDTKLDNLSAQTTNMLFPDADKDGLPDAWEIANGSNPNLYDRDAINPVTGQPFLDGYLASLWPAGSTAANGITGAGNIGTIPPLTIMGQHTPVGALKGSFSVGGDGSGTYSIPIDLPKGTGGMEPKLSLSYSSGSGNGVVGSGFAISGLQMITRGKATFKKDGFASTEDYGTDRFFLNGEKLVCVGGTYGANGSEYRTEIDSFSRIRLTGTAASGDSSWLVETKAGLIIEFGATADSRVKPSAAPAPLSWAVNKVSDTVGNYYLVNYESDTPSSTSELLNHRIKDIQYTGNAAGGLTPYSTISFLYEARPDITSPHTRGLRITSAKRLEQIKVQTGSTLNHRYKLAYEVGTRTATSRLVSVTKFQGTGEQVPATNFAWNAKPDTSVRSKWGGGTTTQNFFTWRSGNTIYSQCIDMNGDGLPDRVDHHNYATGQPGLWVSINQGNTFASPLPWYSSTNTNQNLPEYWSSTNQYGGLMDMNGDGLPDKVDSHDYTTNQPGVWVSLNTGSGFATKIKWYSSSNADQSLVSWNAGSRYSGFVDVNNDGLPDKVDSHNYETNQPGIWIAINTGTGFLPKTKWYTGGETSQNLLEWTSGNTVYSMFCDMNGDGLPDRVDHYDHTTGQYGLWVSLNTGTSFDTANKKKWYSTTNSTQAQPESWSANDRLSGLIDMNGDGLPDRVDYYNYATSQYGLWVSLNTGDGFAARANWFTTTSSTRSRLQYCSGDSILSELRDVNGDGLPDKIDNNNDATGQPGLWVSLNTGKGFATPTAPWYLGTNASENMPKWASGGNVYSSFLDINGDGLPDRVDHYNYTTGQYGIWVSLNTGSSFLPRVLWSQQSYAYENMVAWGDYSGFIDLNGDGLLDRWDHYNYVTGQYGYWVSLNKGNGFSQFSSVNHASDALSTITDGFGTDIKIDYARLTDPAAQAGFGTRVYQKGPATLPAGQHPALDLRLVVARYSQPDGLGGRVYKSQRYGDLRNDRLNETSLGFGVVEALDEQSGQRSRTEMRRDYPFASSPAKVESFVNATVDDLLSFYPGVAAGLKRVSRELSEYGELPSQAGIGGGTIRRPVQTRIEKTSWDLGSDPLDEATALESRTISQQDLANFDSYGFVEESTVTSLDGTTVVTQSEFNHDIDVNRWHLGRLEESTTTKSGAGKPTITKSAAFTYAANGLLETEKVEPLHAMSVTKSYVRDAFGNIVSTTATSSAGTRVSFTDFEATGRFPVRERNVMGHEVTYEYDLQKALLRSSTDIGGRTSWMHYDAFGTLIRTDLPGGLQSGEVTGFTNNASLPSSISAELGLHTIKYFRAKESSGTPVAKVYLDAMGRELVAETTILRDASIAGTGRFSKSYVVSRYDSRGRKIQVSNPFAAGETPAYSLITYDSFDRVLERVHPDGKFERILGHNTIGLITYGLSEQPVTYSHTEGADESTVERYEDQHGRLVQSKDKSGLLTTYHHDHEGRLVRVAMNGVDLLTNTYDLFGNKTSVWEVNSGTSSSIYNAFGEVISTTNAKGQTTSYAYDALGRQTTVTKPEGTYHLYYDHARGNGIGQPWKTTGPSAYEEEIAYDALGRPASTRKTQFGETFTTAVTYDAMGRALTSTDAGGLVVLNQYDSLSNPVSITLAGAAPGTTMVGAGTVLWEAGTFDSSGRALTQKLALGIEVSAAYNPLNGLATGLQAHRGPTILQDKTYEWDGLGNLSWRHDHHTQRIETFGYDSMNRLATATVADTGGATSTVPAPQSYTYDSYGNLKTKGIASESRTYAAFGPSKPHAVTHATIKGFNRTYSYDAAGFVVNDSKRSYCWTSFGQLKSICYEAAPGLSESTSGATMISGGRIFTSFDFDAAGNRARQIKERLIPDASTDRFEKETTLYLGSYERELRQSKAGTGSPVTENTVHRHSFGSVIYTKTEVATIGTFTKLTTVLKDHLGSTDHLQVGQWHVPSSAFLPSGFEFQAFDAWGERRKLDHTFHRTTDADDFAASEHDYDRGYTGHEQLDDVGLIHMNGRIYDPELGRFLSPDPYVQVPENSQNFNRYSYVLNNPLNATDPSGHLFMAFHTYKKLKWAKNNWDKIGPYVGIVVAVVLWWTGVGAIAGAAIATAAGATGAAAAGVAWAATMGSVMGGVNAAMSGGDWGDILKGALISGGQAALSAGVLHNIGVAAGKTAGGFDDVTHVVGHGVVGGAANAAMGGKFSDGFLSAAAGASAGYAMGMAGISVNGDSFGAVATRTAISGVVGGTASTIGGGKFANGFGTAALQHLFNMEFETDSNGNLTDRVYMGIPTDPVTPFFIEGVIGGGIVRGVFAGAARIFRSAFGGSASGVRRVASDSVQQKILQSGARPDRKGLSMAGRALQKHGDRAGSVFPKIRGNQPAINEQGQKILDEVLSGRNLSIRGNPIGGRDIFSADTGMGVRLDKFAQFVTFLEPH